jgi:hypothetical protein
VGSTDTLAHLVLLVPAITKGAGDCGGTWKQVTALSRQKSGDRETWDTIQSQRLGAARTAEQSVKQCSENAVNSSISGQGLARRTPWKAGEGSSSQ